MLRKVVACLFTALIIFTVFFSLSVLLAFTGCSNTNKTDNNNGPIENYDFDAFEVLTSQGREYIIKKCLYSENLPANINPEEFCDVIQIEYDDKKEILCNDGSIIDGYFVVTIELSTRLTENTMRIHDDGIEVVTGIGIFATNGKESTLLHPDYVSESVLDELISAGDPRVGTTVGYHSVDFSSGEFVDLTLCYILSDELYNYYDNWFLHLNTDGVPFDDYDRLTGENGVSPYVIISLPERS